MTGTNNLVQMPIKVEIKKRLANQCVLIMMRILRFDVPNTPQEKAFLMELMTKLAIGHDKTPEEGTTFIKLTRDQAVGLWHCCNVVSNNPELLDSMEMKVSALEILEYLAPKLDGVASPGLV